MGSEGMMRLIAANEEKIMQLYSLFAEEFPEREAFWTKIAGDEKVHAELVKELARMESAGAAIFDKKRFGIKEVKALGRVIDRENKLANSKKYTYRQALSAAAEIEQSLIEMDIFESYKADEEQVKDILGAIQDETQGHLNLIIDEIKKFGREDGGARKR